MALNQFQDKPPVGDEAYVNTGAPARTEDPTNPNADMGYGIPDETANISELINTISGLKTSLESKEVPTGAAQVLPPNYYTPDMNRPVIGGQISTPLGSLNLMSAGVPMFSPAILQQAEEELKAAKRAEYVQKMKDADNILKGITPVHISDSVKDMHFINMQHNFWNKYIPELKEKYGSNAFRMGAVDIKMAAEKIKSIGANFNDTFALAKDINMKANVAKDKTSDVGVYVSPAAAKAAKEYLELTMSADFQKMDIDKLAELNAQYKKKFIKAISLDESTKPIVEAINGMKLDDDKFKRIVPSSGESLYAAVQKGGGAAYKALESVVKKEYEENFRQIYDDSYKVIEETYGKDYVPSYDDFIKTALGRVKWKDVNIYKELSQHKPDSDGGGAGKTPKVTYTSQMESTINRGGQMTTYTLNDVQTFKRIPFTTKQSGVAVLTNNGNLVPVKNYSVDIDRTFNEGGYSFATLIDKTDKLELVVPLTRSLADNIKSNNPEWNEGYYKVYSTQNEIDKANRYMTGVNPATTTKTTQTPAPTQSNPTKKKLY